MLLFSITQIILVGLKFDLEFFTVVKTCHKTFLHFPKTPNSILFFRLHTQNLHNTQTFTPKYLLVCCKTINTTHNSLYNKQTENTIFRV